MTSNHPSMTSEINFIHPVATRWANVTTLTIVVMAACVYMLWPNAQAIQHGNGDAFEPGDSSFIPVMAADRERASMSVPVPAPQSTIVSAIQNEKANKSVHKPNEQTGLETDQSKVILASSNTQPLDEGSIQNRTTDIPIAEQRLQDSQAGHAQTVSPSFPESKNWIVAGETAPHYALESLELSKKLAKDFGGRFLVTDRNIAIDLGRTLSTISPEKMRVVGQAWHEQYANRMVPLRGAEVDRALSVVLRRFPQLSANAVLYLSVPHAVDREIYTAQRRSLGESWDVSLVTVMGLRGNAFEVLAISP